MPEATARVRFSTRDLVLDPTARFTLVLTPEVAEADVSLVLDIYDLAHPVHPEGHLGWWKFALDSSAEPAPPRRAADPPRPPVMVAGELAYGAAGLSVGLDGLAPLDHWLNPDLPHPAGLAVIAVLRSNVTNAIVHMERLPAFADAAELAAFRARVSRDWTTPRYDPASFVAGPTETVHLVAPSIRPRDAVGNLCLEIYRMLAQNGIPARLHAETTDLSLNDLVEPEALLADAVGPDDQLLYFYSIDDPHLAEITALACRRKTVYFHGITDPRLLRVFDPELSVACARALASLPMLGAFDRIATNSAANADVVARVLGGRRGDIAVLPPVLVPVEQPAPLTAARHDALLFVGQVRPHKKLEDLLKVFSAYRALAPAAECWIVGDAENKPYRDYLAWVEREELQLPEGSVHWLGSVEADELRRRYATAAAYVSMSEDEGFCVPIFEAMQHGLPVFAYAIPAVLETLGGAGIGFSHKDHAHLAGQIRALLEDAPRRAAILALQAERAETLQLGMHGAGFLRLLMP